MSKLLSTCCLNWKVIAGLAFVALGIWAVAPNLIWAALPVLLLLICPLSMLLMMWGMQRGQCAAHSEQAGRGTIDRIPTQTGPSREEQLAALKAQLVSLQTHHEAIAREIAALEATTSSAAVREAEAVARAADERVQERS